MKGKTITFRPRQDMKDRIDRLAKALERSKTWVVEKAIEGYLPTLEERYATELAEAVKYPTHQDQYSRTEDRPRKPKGGSSAEDIDRKATAALKKDLARGATRPKG